MEAEGIEPNLIMLNVLINAFAIAQRHLEALSVYQHIKESVGNSHLAFVVCVCVYNLILLTFNCF